jgi:hypothetical protein
MEKNSECVECTVFSDSEDFTDYFYIADCGKSMNESQVDLCLPWSGGPRLTGRCWPPGGWYSRVLSGA